jgi:hypothetical protein
MEKPALISRPHLPPFVGEANYLTSQL